jgi:hypothetical protein
MISVIVPCNDKLSHFQKHPRQKIRRDQRQEIQGKEETDNHIVA